MNTAFRKAYQRLLMHEGTYSFHPNDTGGETYKGIARRANPNWEGWEIIDNYKDAPSFPHILDGITILDIMVQEFYKERYWDTLKLDLMEDFNLKWELFDISVNMGQSKAGKFLQEALNLLNRAQRDYSNISVDGNVGPKTLKTLEIFLASDPPCLLSNVINLLQGEFYLNIMRHNESQEVFARGWLKRVEIKKY